MRRLADDIVQESFMRLLRAKVEAMDDREIKPYLYRIATNLTHDHFRGRQRERKRQEGLTAQGATDSVDQTSTEETEMTSVFGKLKTQERALLWLAYVEGYEHGEIAQVLRLNRMSVRVLLYRARRNLARLLEGEKTEG